MAPEAPLAAEAGEEHARPAVLRNTPFTVSAAAVRAAAERFGEIEAVRQAKRTFFVLFAAAAAAEAAREAGNVRRVGPVAPRGGVRAAAAAFNHKLPTITSNAPPPCQYISGGVRIELGCDMQIRTP